MYKRQVYARNLGVDINNLLISQPDNGEQALEITEALVRSGAVDIVVVDSVAALVPKAEIDGEMGDEMCIRDSLKIVGPSMGSKAREILMSPEQAKARYFSNSNDEQ